MKYSKNNKILIRIQCTKHERITPTKKCPYLLGPIMWNKWIIRDYRFNHFQQNDITCWACTFPLYVRYKYIIVTEFTVGICAFQILIGVIFNLLLWNKKDASLALSWNNFVPLWAPSDMSLCMTSNQHKCIPGQRSTALWSIAIKDSIFSLGSLLDSKYFLCPLDSSIPTFTPIYSISMYWCNIHKKFSI